MTAPNIVSVATITGKTAVSLLPSTTTTTIVTNSSGSGKVLKVNAMYVGNINASTAYDITVSINRSSVAYRFLCNVSIPAKATLDVINKSIYLEEGDLLQIFSTSSLQLEVVCSYEEIS